MLDWDDVRFFLAVSRRGTLAAAASALGLDATTVGRRLARLEEGVGTRLFDRTPKGWVITVAGERLVPRAERIEREMLAAVRDVEGEDQRLVGNVRLTATEMLATRFIAPHLGSFHRRYPEIRLELVCTHRDLDLGRREADVALRLMQPQHDDLVVKRLFAIELGLYAAFDYVEANGMPQAHGFAGHRMVRFADTRAFERENEWLDGCAGQAAVVLRSDSVSSIFSATVAGLGIALLPCKVAEAEPRLRRIPVDGAPEPRMVWQAVHRDLAGAARIRAVVEFLGRLFGPGK
jgi:DNA-binding transcriptional LysR family regulator